MRIFVLVSVLVLTLTGCGVNAERDGVEPFLARYDGRPPVIEPALYKSPQTRPLQDEDLALAVCISGGGHRASNFGMGVLLALEDITKADAPDRNVLREIDYISTVSGGGFCGAAYVSSLHYHLEDGGSHEDFRLRKTWDDGLKKTMRANYEWTVLAGSLNPVNWFTSLDRGDNLQKKIDSTLLRYEDRRAKDEQTLRLSDMFVPCAAERPATLPWLITNASVYANRAIFPFAPNVLRAYLVREYTHRRWGHDIEVRDEDILDATYQAPANVQAALDRFDMPVSVGVKASASFPGLWAMSTLTSAYPGEGKFIHLEDGGVAENLGYISAINTLRADTAARRKILIVVDAYNGNLSPWSRIRGICGTCHLISLAGSNLESSHRIVAEQIEALCRQHDIRVLFVSLNQPIPVAETPKTLSSNGDRPQRPRKFTPRQMVQVRGIRTRDAAPPRAVEVKSEHDLQTRLSIEKEQQDDLIRAASAALDAPEVQRAIARLVWGNGASAP